MAATIKDISKMTGLGLATISSYLNGGNVRDKNRVKIEEAIEKLHFEVNEVARGLKTNSTKTIGIIIPELNNTFCAEIITAMEDTLRKKGYATIICDCRTDVKREEEAVEFLMHKRVDGIVNMPVDTTGSHLKKFIASGKPVVLLDRRIAGLDCDSIYVDNRTAAQKAVEECIISGHNRIGIIAGPDNIYTAQERLRGYKDALKKAGIAIDEKLIFHGSYTIEAGENGFSRLVRENPDMTALFIVNYELTVGAMIEANEKNIRIPEQLSIVGFDNLSFARACKPQLTVVTQPTDKIGLKAAQLILQRLGTVKMSDADKENESSISVKLQTKIIQGKSIRKVQTC